MTRLTAKSVSLGILLTIASSSSFALCGLYYMGGSLGASVGQLGNHYLQYNNGNFVDQYYIVNHPSVRTQVGLKLGFEMTGMGLRPRIAVGFGLYTVPTSYTYHGQLIEGLPNNSLSSTYMFNYELRSTRFMAEMRYTWVIDHVWTPFFDVGAGVAWNHAQRYNQGLIIGTALTSMPEFRSYTNTNFAYQIGAGIGYAFNVYDFPSIDKYDRLQLGYRYVDTGPTTLASRGGAFTYNINPGRLSANEYYLEFVHLF